MHCLVTLPIVYLYITSKYIQAFAFELRRILFLTDTQVLLKRLFKCAAIISPNAHPHLPLTHTHSLTPTFFIFFSALLLTHAGYLLILMRKISQHMEYNINKQKSTENLAYYHLYFN